MAATRGTLVIPQRPASKARRLIAGIAVHLVVPPQPGLPYAGECAAAIIVRIPTAEERPDTAGLRDVVDLAWWMTPHRLPNRDGLRDANGMPVGQEPAIAGALLLSTPRATNPLEDLGAWHFLEDCPR